MNFKSTIFDSIYDNRTHNIITKRNWSQFSNFLFELSKIPYTKKTAPLISPAIYKSGTTRSNANVIAWAGWTAFDIDNNYFKSVDQIQTYMDQQYPDHAYCCYSSASCKKEHLKFRIIFPLLTWIEDPDKIQIFWYCMNKKLSGLVDQQTKDRSRMFYVPADYQEAELKFFWISDGKTFINPFEVINTSNIDINEITLSTQSKRNSSFLATLPLELQKTIAMNRKRQLEINGKFYNWTSWKNCPFCRNEAVNRYKEIVLTRSEGRYLGLYKLMVDIARTAILKEYPITEQEIASLVHEIDNELDGYYQNRKIDTEIKNAISYAYTQGSSSVSKSLLRHEGSLGSPDTTLDEFLKDRDERKKQFFSHQTII